MAKAVGYTETVWLCDSVLCCGPIFCLAYARTNSSESSHLEFLTGPSVLSTERLPPLNTPCDLIESTPKPLYITLIRYRRVWRDKLNWVPARSRDAKLSDGRRQKFHCDCVVYMYVRTHSRHCVSFVFASINYKQIYTNIYIYVAHSFCLSAIYLRRRAPLQNCKIIRLINTSFQNIY